MRMLIIVTLTALSLLNISLTTAQNVPPMTVLGIRLGMPAEEAIATINTALPGSRIERYTTRSTTGGSFLKMVEILNPPTLLNDPTTELNNQKPEAGERIYIFFLETGTVWAVARSSSFSKEISPRLIPLRSDVVAKYGRPSLERTEGERKTIVFWPLSPRTVSSSEIEVDEVMDCIMLSRRFVEEHAYRSDRTIPGLEFLEEEKESLDECEAGLVVELTRSSEEPDSVQGLVQFLFNAKPRAAELQRHVDAENARRAAEEAAARRAEEERERLRREGIRPRL